MTALHKIFAGRGERREALRPVLVASSPSPDVTGSPALPRPTVRAPAPSALPSESAADLRADWLADAREEMER